MAGARRRRQFRACLEQRLVLMQGPFVGPEEAITQQATEEDVDLGLEDVNGPNERRTASTGDA